MRIDGFKIIDIYIIKKFLGAYFFAIALIISIAVVFDLSERVEDFIEKEAPLKAIVFDYYMNFIPYFANLFSSLFTFIAVIFFTSKMAYNTEIIAILSAGVSFRRIMLPYFISAFIIALFSFMLMAYVIPPA
ncbi:MAG: LptF/LptG family permease, partial [Bacteroidales bacterium]|nr:LptF/LptG family permease [Bacteroidales bacterium]